MTNNFQTETFTLDNGLEMTSIVSENEHEERKEGVYEQEVLYWMLDQDFNFYIDIGAFTGYFALHIRNRLRQVLCFEPSQKAFNLLDENFERNFSGGFGLRNKAISNQVGKSEAGLGGCPFAEMKSAINVEGSQSVLTTTLDEFFSIRSYDLSNQSVCLKIDIEGMELPALKGAEETLNNVEYLVLEVHPSYVSDEEIDETFDLIKERGFQSVQVTNGHNRYKHNCNICFAKS